MSEAPDTHELARRVCHQDKLFEELHKVVTSLLEWKDKISGGMSVMVWVVGCVQSVVLVCLGFAANSLNNTANILGQHAIELATSRTKIEAYMAHDTDRDSAAENRLRVWVREEIDRSKNR